MMGAMVFLSSRIVFKSLLLVFVFSLYGCDSAKLERLPDDGKILAFGDSLTVGIGTTKNNSYPSVLAELTAMEVIGSGVSGETTEEGLRRLPGVLEKSGPDLLILLEGGNDILQNVSPALIKSNLSAMILMAQDQGIQVLLIGVPEKKLFSRVAPLYKELAEENDVILVEELLGDLLRTASFKSDRVHLNEAGYRTMAESIFATMQKLGAI